MNLPNDVSRCMGLLDRVGTVCPHRCSCQRHTQIAIDNAGLDYLTPYPIIPNCLVNGEYTMRIET